MGLHTEDDKQAGAEQPRQNNDRKRDDRRDEPRDDRADDRKSQPAMRNMGRSLGRALGRNNAGEALSKAFTAFDQLFHNEATSGSHQGDTVTLEDYKLLMLDQVEARVDMSSVVFTYQIKDGDQAHVFYYTMLVEGSTPSLAPIRCDERNRTYEIPRTAGDVLNARYSDRVYALVESQYEHGAKIHDCGTNVLPSNIDPEDVKNASVIRNLAFYANAAIETISVELLGYQPSFTLNWLERDDSLEVEVDWSGTPQYSAAGAPRRTDVKICITSNVRDRSEGGDSSYRDQLSRVGGSFELIYSPAQQSGSSFGIRRNQEETQLFTPLFTITDLDTDFKAITLEMQLLGMASTATLSDDLLWVNNFRPTGAKAKDSKDRDYKDIGALNYLAPQGTYFDIKSANLGTDGFLEYFGTLCRAELAYAMDVEERGDNSWMNSVFMEASQGSESSLQRIFDAADNLTDNHFSSIYRQMSGDRSGHNPFEDSQNRIMLGWYKENGETYDLRNIDLLYWLNRRGDQDQGDLALDWQDTYDMVKEPVEVRIDKRIRILADIFGDSGFKVTGYAQQLFIDSVFIAALAAAVKACDVRIDQSNTTNNYGNVRPRGNYNIGRLAGGNLGGGLFARTSRRDDNGGGRSGRTFTGRGR